MKIETKFNPDDEVWKIVENKVVMLRIRDICIHYIDLSEQTNISYTLTSDDSVFTLTANEDSLFSSKKELLKNL